MAKAEALGQVWMKGVVGDVAKKIMRDRPESTLNVLTISPACSGVWRVWNSGFPSARLASVRYEAIAG